MTGTLRSLRRAAAVGLAAGGAALFAGSCTSSNLNLSTPTTSTTPTTDPAETTPATAPATTAVPTTTSPATVIASSASLCRARVEYGYVLPDPACTPGVINPSVTQGNIGETICAYGWTKTIRPPESYTEALKRSQMAEYGDTRPIYDYEEDHLVPLELGGAPSDPHNLWPDPGESPNPKDDIESAANRAVCDGAMTLAEAQHEIAADWVSLGRTLGVITGPGDQYP